MIGVYGLQSAHILDIFTSFTQEPHKIVNVDEAFVAAPLVLAFRLVVVMVFAPDFPTGCIGRATWVLLYPPTSQKNDHGSSRGALQGCSYFGLRLGRARRLLS